MRFAVVAAVAGSTWTACAVRDDLKFGLKVGGRHSLNAALCFESRSSRAPIVIEHASFDPLYRTLPVTRFYRIESYISVPIILGGGRYFGNLCALDSKPATLSAPCILAMFKRFAALIAYQLDHQLVLEEERRALFDERAAGEPRGCASGRIPSHEASKIVVASSGSTWRDSRRGFVVAILMGSPRLHRELQHVLQHHAVLLQRHLAARHPRDIQ